MRRRDFINLIGAAPLGWSYAARADRALDGVLYFTHSAGYYQISDFDNEGSHVLLRLDANSVYLTLNGVRRRFYGWPLAWTRTYGRGRVFYMALGHEEAVWRDARYQQILLNAILWSIRKTP